jgi:hypothetical protein
MLLAITAGLAISTVAFAGDVAAPAAPIFPIKAAQPYQFNGSGPFFGIYTEAGGGPVNANVPGVATASLTTTSAAIGATVGYAHKFANGLVGTVEADVCAKNFNGANAGFSLAGPLCMEQRAMIFAPTDQVANAISFLNIPNPFANLANIVVPNGATVKSSYLGFGGGAYWNDMTIAYQGVGANKVWSVNPELVVMKMDLLTTNTMLRTFAKVDLESQTTVFGAHQSAAKTGVGGRAGLGWAF